MAELLLSICLAALSKAIQSPIGKRFKTLSGADRGVAISS
jgi:hypothetical protein